MRRGRNRRNFTHSLKTRSSSSSAQQLNSSTAQQLFLKPPRNLLQHPIHPLDHLQNVLLRMRRGEERGFELRWRQIHALAQHEVEKARELFAVRGFRRVEIEDRALGEESRPY